MSALEFANRLRRLPLALPRHLGAEVLRVGSRILHETYGGALVRTTGCLMLADAGAVLISVLLMVSLADSWAMTHALSTFLAPVLGVSLIVFLVLIGHYPAAALNPIDELREVAVGAAIVIAVYLVASIGSGRVPAGWILLVPGWLATLTIIAGGRALARRICARFSWWGFKAVVVGDPEATTQIRDILLSDPTRGLRPHLLAEASLSAWGGADPMVQFAVLVSEGASGSDGEPAIEDLKRRFRHVIVLSPGATRRLGRLAHRPMVPETPATGTRHCLESIWRCLLKRAFDLAGAILLSPILIGLAVLVAAINKMTSPGPTFYGHTRIGKDGRTFRAWKFRTMVPHADRLLHQHLERHPEAREEWARTQKLENDPRVTASGRWLRRASLDELPQVWNVLRGEMSLIGPRPIVRDEIQRYGDSAGLYLAVKPGLTGLWQVSGRNKTTYPERVALDSYYVRNWCLWLDLYIFARTFRAVATGDGAS
jgi:Undecaprenyl-phosphate galactose phosphotransferase WbaP